jgi:hypothetical protein
MELVVGTDIAQMTAQLARAPVWAAGGAPSKAWD